MPNSKSAAKELRKTKTRTRQNKMVKAKVKNLVKASIKKVQSGDQTDLDGATRKAIQAIDKAAKKAVIKKNTASRMKSALMKRINAGPKK